MLEHGSCLQPNRDCRPSRPLNGIRARDPDSFEAGKKAAGGVIALKLKLVEAMKAAEGEGFTAEQWAERIGEPTKAELAFKILEHLAANRTTGVRKRARKPVFESSYRIG